MVTVFKSIFSSPLHTRDWFFVSPCPLKLSGHVSPLCSSVGQSLAPLLLLHMLSILPPPPFCINYWTFPCSYLGSEDQIGINAGTVDGSEVGLTKEKKSIHWYSFSRAVYEKRRSSLLHARDRYVCHRAV